MVKKHRDMDATMLALKYPDYHLWRDLEAAKARGGFWENGEMVRLSDPEMKPEMDEEKHRIKEDPVYRRQILLDLGLIDENGKFTYE
jgi:hypothetical protein